MIDALLGKKLDEQLARYRELTGKLSDPATIGSDSYAELLRVHGVLSKNMVPYETYLALEKEAAAHREAMTDPELRELAIDELKAAELRLEEISNDLVSRMSGENKDDSKNVILEIRAGTGGDEAALFAGDLYRMYARYAERRGWKTEEVSMAPGDHGGFKEIVVGIQGENVYRDLQWEGGGHRVQRVPETEAQGRIHTSAATVAVLPEVEEFEVDIRPDDLHIETCRSSGPGGQHANKTDSAVRMVHLPTGIMVHIADEKSQHKNRAKAMRILRSRVYESQQAKLDAERSSARRQQTGSGDRSERIRTYNWPQSRCTDHRLGRNFSLQSIIDGDLENLIEALVDWGKQQHLAAEETSSQ